MVDLPCLLLQAVAQVAEHEGRFLFIDRREVQQAEIVVFQDQQHLVACAEPESMPHHMGDPVGEAVILGVGVAPIALHVNDGGIVPESQCHSRHDTTEVRLHVSPPWHCPLMRALAGTSDKLAGFPR